MDVRIRLRSVSPLVVVVVTLATVASVVAPEPQAAYALQTAGVDGDGARFLAPACKTPETAAVSQTVVLADPQDGLLRPGRGDCPARRGAPVRITRRGACPGPEVSPVGCVACSAVGCHDG
jgi:hypothetical protein